MAFDSAFVLDNFRAAAVRTANYSQAADSQNRDWNKTASQVYVGLHKAAYTKSLNTEFKAIAGGLAINALSSMIPGSHILVRLGKALLEEAGASLLANLAKGGTMVSFGPNQQTAGGLTELVRYTNTGDPINLIGSVIATGIVSNYSVVALATGGPANPAVAVRRGDPQVVSIGVRFTVKDGNVAAAHYRVENAGSYVQIPSGSWFGG